MCEDFPKKIRYPRDGAKVAAICWEDSQRIQKTRITRIKHRRRRSLHGCGHNEFEFWSVISQKIRVFVANLRENCVLAHADILFLYEVFSKTTLCRRCSTIFSFNSIGARTLQRLIQVCKDCRRMSVSKSTMRAVRESTPKKQIEIEFQDNYEDKEYA